jgi:hypothetical protein
VLGLSVGLSVTQSTLLPLWRCGVNVPCLQQEGVTWAETASQQLLKMFRDYVFHQVL